MVSSELDQAIKRTAELFKSRDRSEDWSRNIIEGSRGLTSVHDWTLYYAYLSTPDKFDPTATYETLDVNAEIEPPPPEFDIVTHKNGCDYEIYYNRKDDGYEADDETEDEKKDVWFLCILI